MHPQKKIMAALNVVGGPLVLLSYWWGATAWPADSVARLWGGVPESVRPAYSSWMFVAAAGYLTYASFLFFRVDAARVRVAGRFGFGAFNVLLALILFPSAVWMPLTLQYIEAPGPATWALVVTGLWATGLASLAMIGALSRLEPRGPSGHWKAAVVGSIAFAGQTFALDSCVWPAMFP